MTQAAWTTAFFTLALFMVQLSVVDCKPDSLPSCDSIPKLLCCTERVLEKCLPGCMSYVSEKCPHKLHKFDKIPDSKDKSKVDKKIEEVVPVKPPEEMDSELVRVPTTEPPSTATPEVKRERVHGVPASPTDGQARQFAELPPEGFIEQQPPFSGPSPADSQRFGPPPSSLPRSLPPSGNFGGASRSGGDYDLLNPKYPVTEVSDRDLTQECGTVQSRPPFSPCLSRKSVDDLFLACCQQHVPSNCHSLCTYEHREHVAAETLISAVQQDGCDLKWLSPILYCANQNRDNRKCCEHLSLASGDLGVGDRCLRMCNVARSGNSIGTVEQNDLVCLSNWNVIMYCARSGLRTIN